MRYQILKTYAWLMRRLAPNSGLTRLSFNRATNRLFAAAPATAPAANTEGIVLDADLDDYHGRILWLFGSNDFKVARTVNALAPFVEDFLDIGANYSTIGFAAMNRLGPGGRVHLFEPQPYLCDRLARAIEENGLGDRVALHRIGLFDRDDEMRLNVPSHHSGMASLVQQEEAAGGVSVPVRDTAAYLEPLVGGRRYGVKIDIEGAEPQVLPGLFATGDMLFCLFEGANNKDALADLFSEAGYVVLGLRRTVLRVTLERVSGEADYDRFHDFLALRVPPEAVPEGVCTLPRLVEAVRGILPEGPAR